MNPVGPRTGQEETEEGVGSERERERERERELSSGRIFSERNEDYLGCKTRGQTMPVATDGALRLSFV